MLAKEALLASVSSSSCRSRRDCPSYSSVMSSRSSTKPASCVPPDAGRTGAMLTRSRWPAGITVTNWADAEAAPPPRAIRSSTVSSACAISCAADDAVNGPPEPDQFGTLGARWPLREPAEELQRALVVEQDLPFEVADKHALVQLGHQRGELVALLRHVPARLGHQPRHVLLQAATLAGQSVDCAGQVADRGAALRNEIGRCGVADQHPCRTREPRRRSDMRRVEPVDRPSRESGRAPAPEHQQHSVRGRQRTERCIDGGALSRVQRHSQQHAAESQPHRQRRARREHGQHQAAI